MDHTPILLQAKAMVKNLFLCLLAMPGSEEGIDGNSQALNTHVAIKTLKMPRPRLVNSGYPFFRAYLPTQRVSPIGHSINVIKIFLLITALFMMGGY